MYPPEPPPHGLPNFLASVLAVAQVARLGFAEEVAKLGGNEASTPDNGKDLDMVDVARAALEISAEDDALVSHSSVPLPVDSYLDRLDSMATEFAGHHLPAHSPDVFKSLGNYLWTYKVSMPCIQCISSSLKMLRFM